MRVGVSLGTALRRRDPQGAASVIGQARAARDAGLDVLSVGDHHATGPMPYLQNTPVLGRLLAEWDERPAGCLFLVPLWNPVLMAEQIGTLAELAAGPFVVQTGLGGGSGQFQAMGVPIETRARRLEEGIEVVRSLLAGEQVTSPTFGIIEAQIAPIPSRGLEWWIGADQPPAIDRAARLGDCWYANADLTVASAREKLDRYREACARHGRTPVRLPIRKDVFLAETDVEAKAVGDALMEAGYRGFDRAAVAYGDPDSVAEQLIPFAELGFTDVILRTMPAPADAAVRSVELAGELRTRLLAV
jgi:alkanesulfonate monooxygenase SsuD/methylene tetrahydromethanopterin reductase-like flavin-dependent oxidoreductase (luciferase family)